MSVTSDNFAEPKHPDEKAEFEKLENKWCLFVKMKVRHSLSFSR